jgi:hypothetical protein
MVEMAEVILDVGRSSLALYSILGQHCALAGAHHVGL